jgi:hypothetical protein
LASCPQATPACLFDQFVGANEQRRRDGYADRLRGLEVDDEIEFGGLLHRKIAGLLTAKNSISVFRHSPESVGQVVRVGDEPASPDRTSVGAKRGQPMLQRQGNNDVVTDVGMRKNNNATLRPGPVGRNGAFDFGRIVDRTGYGFDAQARRSGVVSFSTSSHLPPMVPS